MPGRFDFDPGIFDGNPFEGLDADEIYRRLRWGDDPTASWSIEAPEDMATIGRVAAIEWDTERDHKETFGEREAPFLAVGAATNMLYIVPRGPQGNPFDPIPEGPYEEVGDIERIDYYSEKDGHPYYFFHDHEPPFPSVFEHKQSGIRIVVPADNDGARSYAVDEPGIIG
jgi:hypothetical protein